MKVGRYRRNRRHDHELRVSRLLNLVLVVLGLARVVHGTYMVLEVSADPLASAYGGLGLLTVIAAAPYYAFTADCLRGRAFMLVHIAWGSFLLVGEVLLSLAVSSVYFRFETGAGMDFGTFRLRHALPDFSLQVSIIGALETATIFTEVFAVFMVGSQLRRDLRRRLYPRSCVSKHVAQYKHWGVFESGANTTADAEEVQPLIRLATSELDDEEDEGAAAADNLPTVLKNDLLQDKESKTAKLYYQHLSKYSNLWERLGLEENDPISDHEGYVSNLDLAAEAGYMSNLELPGDR